MVTCLRWILGYMRLEIWRKIGLSADGCSAKRVVALHATIGLASPAMGHWDMRCPARFKTLFF